MNISVVKIYFPYILVIIGLKQIKIDEVVFFVSLGFFLFIFFCIKNKNYRNKNFLILLISFFLISVKLYNNSNKYRLIVDREISAIGEVLERKNYNKDTNFQICKIKLLNTESVINKLNCEIFTCLFYKENNPINKEDIIKFKGILTKNENNILIIKNCHFLYIVENDINKISTNYIRYYLENTFSKISINKEVNAFINAIILGNTNLMNNTEKDTYRNSGTMHLFAVSGIHIGFIYLFINLLFSLILRNKFFCQGLITVLLVTYLDIVNYPPSAQRAVVMIIFWQITKLFDKKINLISSLLWSALITVLLDSEQLFSVGYQLSYTVVFGIIIIFNTINSKNENKLINFFLSSLKTSYAAFCGSMLLIFDYFGMIVPGSILINMLIVPICFILLIILFFTVLFFPILNIYFFSELIYFFKYLIDFIINILTYKNFTFFFFEERKDVNNLYHLIYPFTFFFYRNFFNNKPFYLVSLFLIPFLIFLFFV